MTLQETIDSLAETYTVESVLLALEKFCRDKGDDAIRQYDDRDTAKAWNMQANSTGYAAQQAKGRGL